MHFKMHKKTKFHEPNPNIIIKTFGTDKAPLVMQWNTTPFIFKMALSFCCYILKNASKNSFFRRIHLLTTP